MNNLYLDHPEFVEALEARRIIVTMHRRHALAVVRQQPEVFGTKSWDAMRVVGCLPFLTALALPWWLELRWYGWLLVWLLAVILTNSWSGAMGQTAIDDVVTHAKQDPMFYQKLMLSDVLHVAWNPVR